MAGADKYLRAPVVVQYRPGPRSKKKKIKIIRGKVSDILDKLSESKVVGIAERAVITHIGVGHSFIPKDKLTKADIKFLER